MTDTKQQAKWILEQCRKTELKDSVFGDSEADWYRIEDNKHIATGYRGSRGIEIVFTILFGVKFDGQDARDLWDICKVYQVESNNL